MSVIEMRVPTPVDGNGEPAIMVMKRGGKTGLTVGRANEIISYSRTLTAEGASQTTKEWSILPYDKKSSPFSATGDSGAAIVDGRGRLGGMVTSGMSYTASLDVTYTTPTDMLFHSFTLWGFGKANLSPELP